VYGWGFTVTNPVTGRKIHRNLHHLGIVGFGNAYLLTGDDRYLDVWRRQIEKVNAQKKIVGGRVLYPHMYGDQGWYDYTSRKYEHGAMELYYWSMRPDDRKRLPSTDWLTYLEGKDPAYPERALRNDFTTLRRKIEGMRRDPTTPDTRLADDPMEFNPATVGTLIELMLGGIHPGHRAAPLHCRVRYFDPLTHRAGLPEDVGALVEALTPEETTLSLVNVNPAETRSLVIQAGAYAEHQCLSIMLDGKERAVNSPHLGVRLAPGAGCRMVLKMKRYANPPTLLPPWEQG
jgi:hypothetical protein